MYVRGLNFGKHNNEALCSNILNATELLDTDAAADEYLAGSKLRGNAPVSRHSSGLDGVMPNVRVQNLDKPHGSRRISSRTWICDPFLKEVADLFVLDSGSVARIIENSDMFPDDFTRRTAKVLKTKWPTNNAYFLFANIF